MTSIKDKAQGIHSSLSAQDIKGLASETENIYKSLVVMSRRARQLGVTLKHELTGKLEEFAVTAEAIEEVTENKEQIEISKFYERLPNPALIALTEYKNGDLVYEDRGHEPDEADQELE